MPAENIYDKFIPAGRTLARRDVSNNWVNRVTPSGYEIIEDEEDKRNIASITISESDHPLTGEEGELWLKVQP